MGYRGQSSPRRGAGEKFQKSSHEKAKSKSQKNKANSKYVEETPTTSGEEIAEKTLKSLARLGSQTFALSPFSQYYDDWLINLRQVISEFESNPASKTDKIFVDERIQKLAETDAELTKRRLKETEYDASLMELADTNHLLVETDVQYANQTRELSAKRDSEISQLTKIVHDEEEELAKVELMKTSFFRFTKNAKAKKKAEIYQKLTSAKKEVEIAVQNFTIEQDKLHDEYEKKKQALMEKVQTLECEKTASEIDSSADVRQSATKALADAVKTLLQRNATAAK
jgi:hypothetical protein